MLLLRRPLRRPSLRHARTRLAALATSVCFPACAAHGALPDYQLVGSFSLPAQTAAYDVLPDGRAIALAGSMLYTQDAPNGASFTLAGSIPGSFASPFGASFLRVNPSGTRLAIGDNNFGPGAAVMVLDTALLSTAAPTPGQTYAIDNYDAHWHDNHTLFVTGANFTDTLVTRLDAGTGDHAPVITSIGGASGGITTDATHLYTANGFSFSGPSGTGDIKAFALASLVPGAPLNFEAHGSLVASLLSGNTLGFDPLANLLVGGGPGGFAGVVDGTQVASAALGGPVATDYLPLSPTTSDTHFIRHNRATGELLVTTFGDPTVYRYAIVPAPASLLLLGGILAGGRRRA